MEFFQKNKKAFLFVGIFILVIILYQIFFGGSNSAPQKSAYSPTKSGLVSEVSVSPADEIVGRELLTVLAQLHSISLDASIFTDPTYSSLQDMSRPLEPQPLGKSLGRRNPFSDFNRSAVSQPSSGAQRGIPASAVGGSTLGR